MSKYHKIQSVFHRDPANSHKTFLEGQWSTPEFEYLQDELWEWDEKIDGTNIRLMWDGEEVEIRGKTDNAILLPGLVDSMRSQASAECMRGVFGDEPSTRVVVYGEGYGPKIQSGGWYRDDPGFIAFDVMVNGLWLDRPNARDVVRKLGLDFVPSILTCDIMSAIDFVRKGFVSRQAVAEEGRIAEGLVGRPAVELLDRRGNRIITKVKHRDFL